MAGSFYSGYFYLYFFILILDVDVQVYHSVPVTGCLKTILS